ncbi:hypothetical protein FKM82_000086 [Ascaphus truei]
MCSKSILQRCVTPSTQAMPLITDDTTEDAISEGKVSPPQWNTDEDDGRKTNLAEMIASSSVSFQNYQSHANWGPPGQCNASEFYLNYP